SRRAAGAYDDSDPQADEKLFEPVELESIALGRTTDWQRLLIRDGFVQNHNLSVSGGSDDTRFNMALGYFNDRGIIPGEDYTRYTARINLDQNIGRRFKIGAFMLGSFSETNGENI